MSLILDALRKMEQDRKSRRGAASDIRPEVLRYRAAVKPQQAKPYLLVAIALVLLATGTGAGIWLRGNRGAIIAQTVAPTAAPTAATAPPAPAAPLEATAPLPGTGLAAPLAPAPAAALAATSPLPVAAPTDPASAASKRQSHAASARAEDPESRPVPRTAAAARPRVEAAGMPPAKSSGEAAADSQEAIPDITVSGIAWQDERRLRRAVLNGKLVGEGEYVAGARVVEIKENRVKLSRGGQVFEVLITSGFSSR